MNEEENTITLTQKEYDRMREAQFMMAVVSSVIQQNTNARTKCVTIDNMIKMLDRPQGL
jgi:hypothetical protein